MRFFLQKLFLAAIFVEIATWATASPASILIEAESFQTHGGWKLDTQFIEEMGSPYLLAHGLGKPVSDASTTIRVESAGLYHVWARTKDWVARWEAPGTPGVFQIAFNDNYLSHTFGT